MIEFTTERLPAESASKLSKWLKQKECAILRRVASGMLRMKQEDHLVHMLRAERADSPMALHGSAALNDARRYADFLSVLDEISNPESPLTIAKLKQSANENGTNSGSTGSEPAATEA